jgi:PAS domain S-box-containing protein
VKKNMVATHSRLNQVIQSKVLRLFGEVLLLVLLIAIAVFFALGLGEAFIFNPAGLILVLHTVFLAVIGIIVAIVSARSYLSQGNLSILLLGTAVLMFAVVALVGAILTFGLAPLLDRVLLSNFGTIINNISTCVSSAVQVLSAIAAFIVLMPSQHARRKTTLAAAYVGVVAFIAALTALTFSGIMPVFITSQGPTLLRTTVLGVTFFLFAFSAILFLWRYERTKVTTLYWYSLALGLFAVAFLSFMLQVQLADSFGWIGRVAEYSGGIFFIVALLQPAAGVDAGVGLSERWAEAFGGNRAQFAALFSNMLDAFVYGKIIVDKGGKPVDWVFLDVNDAYERMVGLRKEQILGKRAIELFPEEQSDPADWIGRYGKVALIGEPLLSEGYMRAMKKWLHVSAYSPKKGYFISIFEDTTERKKAEEVLRYNETLLASFFDSPGMMRGIVEVIDDKDIRHIKDNLVTASYLGLTPADLEGKLSSVLGEPYERIKIWIENYKKSQETNVPVTWEYTDSEGPKKTWLSPTVTYIGKSSEGRPRFTYVVANITERKKVEEELEKFTSELEERVRQRTEQVSSERQRLYNVLETLPAYVVLLDKDHCVPFANKVFRERFGESHGRRCHEYLFNRDSECDNCITYKVYKENKPQHWYWTGPDKRDYDIYDFPFREADGSTLILEMGIDITEGKRAEEQVKSAALYTRSLIEASLDPLVTISAEGKITDVNKATEENTGFLREELIGKNFSEYFTDPQKAEEGYKKVFTDGFVRDYPLTIRSKTGKITEVLYNAAIYTDDKGQVQGVFAAARDVTDLNKAQAAVKSERKRLFDVLDTLPAMVCLLTSDYHVVFANRKFKERFGESEGRPCYEYCWNQKEPCKFCESMTPFKTGQPHHWEVQGPDGTVIEAHDYPFTDTDGTQLVLEMDLDITARKKAEAEAAQNAQKLKDAERLAAIGATAGMVGHDIRNPLQAITSDVYLAKTELTNTPESEEKENALESLREIEKNIDYINKIVQDLQDYARPLNPKVEESDLRQIVESLFAKNGFPENIDVKIKVAEDTRKIRADPYYLNRVLFNLVTNAVQAMPQGGKLTVASHKEGNDTIITVSDTGVGIPKAIQEKMFTLMFTTKSKGQGFGLPVVKRMTESLGGTVTFESQEGKGTKFTVRLPPSPLS